MCYFLALQKFLLVEISYKDRHKKIGWKKKSQCDAFFSPFICWAHPNISDKTKSNICLTEQEQSIEGEANIFEHQLENILLW